MEQQSTLLKIKKQGGLLCQLIQPDSRQLRKINQQYDGCVYDGKCRRGIARQFYFSFGKVGISAHHQHKAEGDEHGRKVTAIWKTN